MGQSYRVVSAQNFYGPNVARGCYDGNTVRLPMQPLPTTRPIGIEVAGESMTHRQFSVFIVLPE
jgi:hypothetical protein